MNQPIAQPIVFLDIDDVICIRSEGRPGGYDAIHAVDDVNSGRVPAEHHQAIWDNLFDKTAVENLLVLHTEFNPTYVMSTSWTGILNQADLSQILAYSGLSFVVRSMHPDWQTPKFSGSSRANQIGHWLAAHPDVKNWVALDDDYSGDGFDASDVRVVFCEVGVGFTWVELEKARAILRG